MPKKSNVSVRLRIAREDGKQDLVGTGTLHQLVTGWAVACQLAVQADKDDPDAGSIGDMDAEMNPVAETVARMTLTIREDEIRMNRSGEVNQEQLFRVGQWQRGSVGTAFGRLETEVWTHRLQVGLAASGGTVEWEYDLRAADQPLGRSTITLHIREELAE